MKQKKFSAVLILFTANYIFSQTAITSRMDWSSGLLQISAERLLTDSLAPDSHPKTLKTLEQELLPLVEMEIISLAWNSKGSIADLIERQPSYRVYLDRLTMALHRVWSRFSADRKSIQAEYSINFSTGIMTAFPQATIMKPAPHPPGWIPLPEDPWTGIIIYAPKNLPLHGTSLTATPEPAFRARILDKELRELAAGTGEKLFTYLTLEQRAEGETIAGRRPYQAVAWALYGTVPCDIILGEDDSRRIMASDEARQALAESRIVILLDP